MEFIHDNVLIQLCIENDKDLQWLSDESGIQKSYLSRIGRGKIKARTETLLKIGKPLNLSASQIFNAIYKKEVPVCNTAS